MAWTPPPRRDLRTRVRFEKPEQIDMPGGIVAPGWARVAETVAALAPRRGGDEVLAARLTGVSAFGLVMDWSPTLAAVTPDYRVVELGPGGVDIRWFEIRWIEDMRQPRPNLWLVAELVAGKGDGRQGS